MPPPTLNLSQPEPWYTCTQCAQGRPRIQTNLSRVGPVVLSAVALSCPKGIFLGLIVTGSAKVMWLVCYL